MLQKLMTAVVKRFLLTGLILVLRESCLLVDLGENDCLSLELNIYRRPAL